MATPRRTAGVRGGTRSERVVSSVRDAVVSELARAGWADLTMNGVARVAQVNRTTLYRRWPSKAALLIEVLEPSFDRYEALAESGTLFDDLLALVSAVRDNIARPEGRALLEAAATSSIEIAPAANLMEARTIAVFREAIARAHLRGELADGDLVDADVAAHLAFYGATSWGRTHDRPPTDDDLRRIVRIVLAAFRAP